MNQEGDGIWARTNMLFLWQAGLFSAFVFCLGKKAELSDFHSLLYMICVIGFMITIWSWVVIRRLWVWHSHWRNQLAKMEEFFPKTEGWVSPIKETLDKRRSYFIKPNVLEPFLIMLLCVWFGCAVLTSRLSLAGSYNKQKIDPATVKPILQVRPPLPKVLPR
jgi:hypothetical protein